MNTVACVAVSTEVAASTEYLCMYLMNQPLTVNIQIAKLANFIIDSNIRKVVQARVRPTGGGFLVNKEKKNLKARFLPYNLCIQTSAALHGLLRYLSFSNYAGGASLKPFLKAALIHIFSYLCRYEQMLSVLNTRCDSLNSPG